MFRTRDFVLLFSVIMFLMSAIGTTLVDQARSAPQIDQLPLPGELAEAPEYSAAVATTEEIPRSERIAQMRAKIATQAVLTAPDDRVFDADDEDLLQDSDETDPGVDGTVVSKCPSYAAYTGFWDARDLTLVAAEGARTVVRGQISSTSVSETVLQLPARTMPAASPYCLNSNVIAIANDGSLIRNDEVALYGIFSSDTLLGYTLDGFPLYGTGTEEVDGCGGRLTLQGYRYELQSGSETILNCFAAAPINLP